MRELVSELRQFAFRRGNGLHVYSKVGSAMLAATGHFYLEELTCFSPEHAPPRPSEGRNVCRCGAVDRRQS